MLDDASNSTTSRRSFIRFVSCVVLSIFGANWASAQTAFDPKLLIGEWSGNGPGVRTASGGARWT